MKTFSDMLEAFDGPSDLSKAIGVGYQTARKMIDRGSVAARHFPKFKTALANRGHKVTLEALAMASVQKAEERRVERAEGEAA